MKTLSFRDVEQLSANLDGKLSQADSTRLKTRLASDPSLRAVMDDFSRTRAWLRKLPARRAPRNFTLTRKMAGVKPPLPRTYPILRFAAALATVLLVVTFATNALAPSMSASAPMAAYSGGGPAEAPTAAARSLESSSAPTLEALATPQASPKNVAPEQVPNPGDQARTLAPAPSVHPIPLAWQIGLLAAALICGGLAWLARSTSEKSWRAKSK